MGGSRLGEVMGRERERKRVSVRQRVSEREVHVWMRRGERDR